MLIQSKKKIWLVGCFILLIALVSIFGNIAYISASPTKIANLGQYKTADSGNWGTNGNVLTNLYDGSTTTVSTAGSTASAWVEFTFSASKNLVTAKLYGNNDGTNGSGTWTLQYWNGSSYVDAFTNSPCQGLQWYTVNINVTTNKVKVIINKPSTFTGCEAAEVELYEETGAATPTPTPSPTPTPTAAALVISNLTVSSGKAYEVVYNGMAAGAVKFIDRTYTFSTVPASVNGKTYIKTANDDKLSTGTSFLSFSVNQDVTVYAGHDDRITAKPSWLSSFVDSGENIVNNSNPSAVTSSLFKKDFAQGTVTLGGNSGPDNNCEMYTVIVVGKGTGSTPTPTPTPAAAEILESTALRIEMIPSPYSYKVIEKSSGEVLVSQSQTTFTVGSGYTVAGAGGVTKTSTTMDATLTLNGTANTAHLKFTFTNPQVVEVLLTYNNGTPTNIKEQFNDQSEHYYGIWNYPFGGNIDNRGADRDLLGVGDMADTNYCSARAPFYVTSKKYGIYTDSVAKGHYTIAVSGKTSFHFDSAQLKYNVIYGPSYAEIMNRFNTLAGPPVMPPLWAFDSIWWRDDHHQDFASGVTNAQGNVLDDANQLRNNQIPASAIWIDRPFGTGTYGWGNLDFDSSFPNPSQMVSDLNARGMKLLVWITNRCKNHLYDEGNTNGYLFSGYSDWPAADMRNTNAYNWFKSELNAFVNLGIKGYKIDRGEEGEMPNSAQNENVYLFAKMTAEGMAAVNGNDYLIFERCAYDKGRKYLGVWSGDPDATFGGLAVSIKNGLRSGAINFPFYASDSGGYIGNPTKELFARWLEFSAYCPMMEALNGPSRTVWYDYDAELITIARTQAAAHHDLIPYNRSYLYKANQTGMPVMRQLIFAYPNDTNLYDKWDEYLFGGEILVAPVITAGATSRSVYLPGGKWLDYNNKSTVFTGATTITASAPLATIPLYVKEGAIIPRGNILRSNDNWTSNWTANLRIEVFPSAAASSFDYYTGTTVQTITSSLVSGTVTVQFNDLGTNGKLEVYCNGYSSVTRNGVTLTPGTDFTYDSAKKLLTVSYSGATTLKINGTASIF